MSNGGQSPCGRRPSSGLDGRRRSKQQTEATEENNLQKEVVKAENGRKEKKVHPNLTTLPTTPTPHVSTLQTSPGTSEPDVPTFVTMAIAVREPRRSRRG